MSEERLSSGAIVFVYGMRVLGGPEEPAAEAVRPHVRDKSKAA